jgi:hypothetical protein
MNYNYPGPIEERTGANFSMRSIVCDRCGTKWHLSQIAIVCPKCGESPPNYQLDGAWYCGVHGVRMRSCRQTGQFLRTVYDEDYRRAWRNFPNLKLDRDVPDDLPSVDSFYCEQCEALHQRWLEEHPTHPDDVV